MKFWLTILITVLFLNTVHCSDCSVEGDLKYFYGEKATGIEVNAVPILESNDNNESRIISGVTDELGWFHLSGLTPSTDYQIVVDRYVTGSECTFTSQQDSTVVLQNSVYICPKPPSDGLWLLGAELTKHEMKPAFLVSHPSIAERRYNSYRHSDKILSASSEDVRIAPTFNKNDGYLIFRNMGLTTENICEFPLYEISAVSYGMGQSRTGDIWLNIPAGWYCNIKQFKIDTLGGGALRYVYPVKGEKEIRCGYHTAAFSNPEQIILKLGGFEPGVYLATPHKMGDPNSGFIFRVIENEPDNN